MVDASKGPVQFNTTSSKKVDIERLGICNIHDERLKYYCEDHKVLGCGSCAFEHHKTCLNVVKIANVAKKGQCDELRSELKTVIATTKQTVENLNDATSFLSFDVQQIPEKLNKIKETFDKMFSDFSINVEEEATSYRDETTAKWTEKKSECENHITTMNKSLNIIEDIAIRGTAFEQFIIARSMSDMVKKQTTTAVSVCADLQKLKVACSFEKHLKKFKSSMISSLTSEMFELKYNVPKKTHLELIASLDLEQRGDDVKQPLYTGLDFLFDGRIVVVDSWNSKCLLYDENLDLQTSYKLPDHPLGIAAVSNEEVTIISGKTMHFLHINKTNEITLVRKCGICASCYSVSIKDDENFVVGCFEDTIPIRIVSKSGDEQTFGDAFFPSKKYPLGASFSTYIRGQNKIVLSDTNEDTIYMFDTKTGEKIAVKDELIKRPCDVVVGPYDNVFVCCEDTNSIVEITPGGRVGPSHPIDMFRPGYLAVSKDRKRFAVSNAAKQARKLRVYKITSE